MAAAQGAAAGVPEPASVLGASARALGEDLARALEAAAGSRVQAGEPRVETVPAGEMAARFPEKSLAFCLELGGVCRGRAALVLPGKFAAGLAALLKGLSEAERTAKSREMPAEEDLEALGGVLAAALPALAERMGAFIGETPTIGLGDTPVIEPQEVGALLEMLGPGPYPLAEFALESGEIGAGAARLVFPANFGETPARTDATLDLAAAGPQAGRAVLGGLHPNILRLLRIKLCVSVVVAEKPMAMESALKLTPGTIIEFSKSADEDLDLTVNGQRIGTGQVVIIGERFGLQLRSIEGLQHRIRKMGQQPA